MKVKNLKCYLLGAMLIANSSIMLSCDTSTYDRIKNKDFYDYLDNNGIVPISSLEDVPQNYYEAIVADHNEVGDEIVISDHYERLDRIDNVICQGREYDYDYRVLKVEENESGGYEVSPLVVEDIDSRPLDYDYVYPDDYVIENGYSDVLINYGKVKKR